jgi:hypothetical protein
MGANLGPDDSGTGMEVFLGPYVHSISREQPLAVIPNGIIGVSHGKVSKVNHNYDINIHYYY